VDLARGANLRSHQRLFLEEAAWVLTRTQRNLRESVTGNWPGRRAILAARFMPMRGTHLRRVRVTVEPPNEVPPWQSCVLSGVLNTPTYGAGIRLAPQARIDDGLLDFAFLEELGVGRLVRILPQLVLQGRLTFRRCEHCNSEKCAWKLRRQPTFKEMENCLTYTCGNRKWFPVQ